jgi:hypothetical protein
MSVLTHEAVASVAAELLARSIVLVGTATRVPQLDYKGSGGLCTLRVPTPRTAQFQESRGATINLVDADESGVTVALRLAYDGALVSDEEMDLDLVDYTGQVVAPQIAAVAALCEDQLAAALAGVVPTITGTIEEQLLGIREALTSAGCPQANRFLACSPSVITAILSSEHLSDLLVRDQTPGQPSALRDASIGRLYSMTVVESAALGAGLGYGYHKSGLAFASFAPSVPAGIGSAASSGGLALAVVKGYAPDRLSTLSIVSSYIGASIVTDTEPGSDESPGEPETLRVVALELGSS